MYISVVISNLSLEGFRSFGNRQLIDLAPLTFVYGPNSAGKSSIIKSLLLLQQSVQFSTNPFPLWRGPQVDLGSVWDSVHGHQPNSAMKVGLTIDQPSLPRRTEIENQAIFTTAKIEFEFSIKGNQSDTVTVEIVSGDKSSGQLKFSRCGADFSLWILNSESLTNYIALADVFGAKRPDALFPVDASQSLPVFYSDAMLPSQVFGHFDGGVQRKQGLEISTNDLFWNRLSTDLNQKFRQEMSKVSYLGPLRKQWSRTEDISQSNQLQQVGSVGENSLSLLKAQPELLASVNTALNETLECGYRLHLTSPTYMIEGAESRPITSPQVMPMLEHLTSNVHVSPVDAGFGLSQLLPILVEMHLREQTLILIEQPELHLHPRLQARMGQLFRNAVRGRNQNRFIIETHSEHLILRIRRLIREGLLTPDMVEVLYVNNQEFTYDESSDSEVLYTTLNSQVLSLRLDEYGDFIDPWPNGFFDERFEELSSTQNRHMAQVDETGGFGIAEV